MILISNPLAPSMEVSSNGLEMAAFAACSALSLPCATPTPICAYPASFMMVVTSAKSRLIIPIFRIRSEIDCTPCLSTLSASTKAFRKVMRVLEICFSRSLGITSRESTVSRRFLMPASACSILFLPSKSKGLVTTATVRMPISRAIFATIGAAPVPVPPPIPAVIKTISAPFRAAVRSSTLSSAALAPTSGFAPAPCPLVNFSPMATLYGATDLFKAALSVFTATNSTPSTPDSIIRLMALFPPPPTPTTLIFTSVLSNCSCISIGIPCPPDFYIFCPL